MKKFICFCIRISDQVFDFFAPLFILVARVYIAKVFFFAAMTKIGNWQSTLYLFEHEYSVPLLSPSLAAYLGTGAELLLPIMMLLGIGSRLMIFALFIFNLVATLSYEFLWSSEGWTGLNDHLQWGIILLLLLCTGFGKISLDYLLSKIWHKK